MKLRSIRAKLVLSLGIPLLVSYVALLSVDLVVNRRAAVTQLQGAILERAEGAARVIDSRLASVTQLDASLTTMAGSGPASAGRASLILRDALNNRFVTAATIVMQGDAGAPIAYAVRRGGAREFGAIPFGGGGPQATRDNGEPAGRFPSGRPGGGTGRGGGFFGPQAAEPTVVPEWYADALQQTAGSWIAPASAATRPLAQRTWLYVEPIRVEGRATGAIGLEVSLAALRTLRPGGPPPEFNGTTRPASPFESPNRPPPDGEPGRDGPTAEPRAASVADATTDLAATAAASSRLASGVGAENDFAIFDADGRLIVAASNETPGAPTRTLFDTARAIGSPAMADAARKAIAGDSGVVSVSGLRSQVPGVPDDRDHWLAMAPIPSTGWFLVTAVGESRYLEPVMQRLAQRATFLGAGLVVMLLVVLVISMRMSRRIERLDAAVARLATGDLDADVPEPDSADEIGRLTRGVANMSRELREHVAELTKQSAEREKAQGELRIARQIQIDLLPRTFPPFPDRSEFELHAINEPARDVAGDFYDFFFTSDGLLTVVVADVSGKGVPAALLMAVTRTLVRTLAGAEGRGPAEIVRGVDAALSHDSGAEMFATMFLCQYEPATGRLRYVNAGHPPPLRLRKGEAPTPFCDHGSPIVGLDEPELGDFEECEEQLQPGDAMLIYTDGVTDAPGATADDYLGLPGLITALQDAGGAPPREVCERLMRTLIDKKAERLRDDTTLLALRRAE